MDLRGDQDRARLGQRLHPRRYVRGVAKNIASGIDHDRSGFEANAGGELGLTGAATLATSAVASSGPTPGMQLRRLLV